MKLFICQRHCLPHVLAAVVVTCVLVTTAFAQSPSLAELARKEQERRKATVPATKVITNKDLPKPTTPPAGAPATPPAAAAVPAADAKAGDEKKPDEEKDVKDEAYWRARMSSTREELRRNQMFMEALQSRINALSSDFVNRDDPYQRAKIGEDRQKAMSEFDRVKTDIEKATKAIADIEEEARQAGVPPGWLR